jgi:enoyl-CoA hydratase/carnithine racemase
LTRLVGTAKARELYVLGDIIDAEVAYSLGLVSRVVEDDALREETTGLARRIANRLWLHEAQPVLPRRRGPLLRCSKWRRCTRRALQ